MKDGFRAVLVRAAIETMRRAMVTAARPMTMTALRAVGTGLEARSGRRVVTRALAVAHSPWSFAARGISDSIPTRGDDDKNAAGVPSTSAGDAKDVRGTAEESANKRKDLYMMFTCGRCETRAAKGFSRQAYDNGVVIVRCPGCQTQHLVADRYGWFGEPGSVEDFLRDRGEVVARTREEGAGVAFLTESEDGTIEADEAAVKAWMDRVKATAVERARAGGEGATDDGRG